MTTTGVNGTIAFRRGWLSLKNLVIGASLAAVAALGLVDGMAHHIAAKNGRGSGWTSIFIPRDDRMLVALHHSMLPVSGNSLRAEIEARWGAFDRSARKSAAPQKRPDWAAPRGATFGIGQ